MDIPDDPIISCMERTGEPPWIAYPTRVWTPFGYGYDDDEDDWEGEEPDVFYGNETQEF